METNRWVNNWSHRIRYAKPVVLLMVLFFLFAQGNCRAQEKSRSVRPPSQKPAHADPAVGIGDLYAVVVGVSKYRHPEIAKLSLADKDARDFAGFLGTQRELFRQIHLTLLVNEQATQQEINRQLLTELRLAGKNDTVVLFFAGHGSDDPNKPGDFFFLAHDSDPKSPEATAINMSGSRFMERLDSKRVLLIADACHAGGFASFRTRSTEPSLQKFMRQMKETEGRLVLSASRADEVSIEKTQMMNGVFTYYLLEGLKGAADANGDGVVTVQELYEHVYEKTKDNTKGIQHPQLDGRVVGKFPLALARSHDSSSLRSEKRKLEEPRTSAPQRDYSDAEIARAIELQEDRIIIEEFLRHELRNVNEHVTKPLLRDHPSLIYFIRQDEKGPLESLLFLEQQVHKLRYAQKNIDSPPFSIAFSGEEKKKILGLKPVADRIVSYGIPLMKRDFFRVIQAAKELAHKRNKHPIALIPDPAFRDEIYRFVEATPDALDTNMGPLSEGEQICLRLAWALEQVVVTRQWFVMGGNQPPNEADYIVFRKKRSQYFRDVLQRIYGESAERSASKRLSVP